MFHSKSLKVISSDSRARYSRARGNVILDFWLKRIIENCRFVTATLYKSSSIVNSVLLSIPASLETACSTFLSSKSKGRFGLPRFICFRTRRNPLLNQTSVKCKRHARLSCRVFRNTIRSDSIWPDLTFIDI